MYIYLSISDGYILIYIDIVCITLVYVSKGVNRSPLDTWPSKVYYRKIYPVA